MYRFCGLSAGKVGLHGERGLHCIFLVVTATVENTDDILVVTATLQPTHVAKSGKQYGKAQRRR